MSRAGLSHDDSNVLIVAIVACGMVLPGVAVGQHGTRDHRTSLPSWTLHSHARVYFSTTLLYNVGRNGSDRFMSLVIISSPIGIALHSESDYSTVLTAVNKLYMTYMSVSIDVSN